MAFPRKWSFDLAGGLEGVPGFGMTRRVPLERWKGMGAFSCCQSVGRPGITKRSDEPAVRGSSASNWRIAWLRGRMNPIMAVIVATRVPSSRTEIQRDIEGIFGCRVKNSCALPRIRVMHGVRPLSAPPPGNHARVPDSGAHIRSCNQ
jgi:hypothetical protein